MNRRTGSLVAAILAIATVPTAAQWLNYPTPGIPRTSDGKPNLTAPTPKTSDGKPDLSGLWTLTKTEGGLGQLKPSEIKTWALKVVKDREETLFKDDPLILCLPQNINFGPAKIVQTPELIVILDEHLIYRQIFLDGRELPKDPNPAWMGYSVGHWEGDTLVVESAGYNDRTWLENKFPHTEDMRITERFHRRDFGHITVDATYRDPGAYEKPWTVTSEMLYTGDTELLEYVCAENEKDRVHLVGKDSDDTKNAVTVPPEILSKYEGTYEQQLPGGRPREYTIALQDGHLTLSGFGAKRPLTALSATLFTSFGLRFEFGVNDKGNATYLIFHIAEGDLRADRKK